MARLNSGFELVASLRQANLAATKRGLEQLATDAAAPGAVDDRRKLALQKAGRVAVARRYFTPSEVQELANILQDNATSFADSAVGLATAAQEFVPPDHRGFGFWDYFAISLYKCERNSDAYLIWNRAVTATPPENDQKDAKTTKASQPKPSPAGTNNNNPPILAEKGPVGNNDANPLASSAKSSSGVKELPLRPRVRGGNAKRTTAEEEPKTAEISTEGTAEAAEGGEKVVEVFVKADSGNMTHIRNNMNFALQKMKLTPAKTDQLPPLESLFMLLHRTRWTSSSIPSKFHAFNPSIIPHPTDPDRFLVNLRAGNYFMNQHHRYEFPPGMSGITTLNFLGSIPTDFRESEFGETKQLKAPPMPHPYPQIGGLEDVRLIWEPLSRKLYASFTSLEVTPEHRPQICLMQIDARRGRIVGNPVRLQGFESDKPQKNWIGFAHGGKLFFIYSLQPITVLQANPKTGDVRVVSVDATPVLNEWRGSSSLVELPQDVLEMLPGYNAAEEKAGVRWFGALVHVSHFPLYHHQFIVVKLTPSPHSDFRPFSLQITHQSPPFVFEKHDVEFSCGFALTPDHAEVVIPYSKRDNDCTCVRISTASLFRDNMFAIPSISKFTIAP